jgi:hypothetical protein
MNVESITVPAIHHGLIVGRQTSTGWNWACAMLLMREAPGFRQRRYDRLAHGACFREEKSRGSEVHAATLHKHCSAGKESGGWQASQRRKINNINHLSSAVQFRGGQSDQSLSQKIRDENQQQGATSKRRLVQETGIDTQQRPCRDTETEWTSAQKISRRE